MTNLSKDLREICGIKPLYKVMLNGIMLDITDDKGLAECLAFKNGGVIVDIYPDFEQPENFVKLMELRFITEKGGILTVVEALQDGRCFTFTGRKSFLFELLDYIFKCEKFGEYIKRAIKETEWMYD